MAVHRLARADLQPASFDWAAGSLPKVDFWLGKYPEDRKRSAVIPLLWLAQKQEGWVSEPALRHIADQLEMPYIRVYEVATFYTMFHLKPVGKHHLQVCGTTPCMLRGANDLKDVCQKRIGSQFDVTADGQFSWEEMECLGACAIAPIVAIHDYYHEDLTAEGLNGLIDDLSAGKEITPGSAIGRETSAREGGPHVLTDESLYDGHLAEVITLPNLPDAVAKAAPSEKLAPTPAAKPSPSTVARAAPAEAVKPPLDSADRPEARQIPSSERDDLKKIKGIGQVNEMALHELGIFTFAQIAAWTPENVTWVEGYLAFPGRINREKWIAQAIEFAQG